MYEPHEYCLAFPDMSLAEFRDLCSSIKEEGLLYEITLFEGKILDGRHRYRACTEFGVEPRFTQYLGKDPISHVRALNKSRRNLSASQLGMVGAKLAKVEEERAKVRSQANLKQGTSPSGSCDPLGRASEIIGEKLGVGEKTIRRAINVRDKGTPEVVKAVEDGKISVTEAERIVKLKPESQRKVVAIEDEADRSREVGRRLQIGSSSRARNASATEGDVYVPGTPYVKRFLARVESVVDDIKRQFDISDPSEMADRFLREMDWNSEQLRLQESHCEKLFAACARIHSEITRSRAA